MAKVLLLNSGGLDSAILAKVLSGPLSHEVHSLFIATDLINNTQTEAAAQQTATNYCASHKVVPIRYGMIPNHWESRKPREEMDAEHLAFYTIDPPIVMYEDVPDPQATYAALPWNEFRSFSNTAMIMASVGVSYAKNIGIFQVFAGHRITIEDSYVTKYDEMQDSSRLQLNRPRFRVPLANYSTYREAIEEGLGITLTSAKIEALRAELAYTHSCRWPTPCGVCEKCTGRQALGLV